MIPRSLNPRLVYVLLAIASLIAAAANSLHWP
jgi:hypothetical protein